MPMEGPCGVRRAINDTSPSPTLRVSIFSQSSQSGIAGESMTRLRSKPITSIPSMACMIMKMLAASDRLGLSRFAAMQNYYNVIYREEEREMMPLCQAEGIAVTPFSPLARGFVVGNRRKEDYGETVRAKTDEFSRKQYYRPEDFAIVDRITEIARKRGVNNAQVALAWVLHQPGITAPIIGASKQGHLEDAVKALALKLDADELKYLSELYKPRSLLANV